MKKRIISTIGSLTIFTFAFLAMNSNMYAQNESPDEKGEHSVLPASQSQEVERLNETDDSQEIIEIDGREFTEAEIKEKMKRAKKALREAEADGDVEKAEQIKASIKKVEGQLKDHPDYVERNKDANNAAIIYLTEQEYKNASPEKQQYIDENPEKYKIVKGKEGDEMNTQSQDDRFTLEKDKDGVMIVTKKDLERMSPERQEFIQNNPDKFRVQ